MDATTAEAVKLLRRLRKADAALERPRRVMAPMVPVPLAALLQGESRAAVERAVSTLRATDYYRTDLWMACKWSDVLAAIDRAIATLEAKP